MYLTLIKKTNENNIARFYKIDNLESLAIDNNYIIIETKNCFNKYVRSEYVFIISDKIQYTDKNTLTEPF